MRSQKTGLRSSALHLIIFCSLFVTTSAVFADKLTVKALYEPPVTWYEHLEGSVWVNDGTGILTLHDFTLEDAYQAKSGTGIGVEYEFKRPDSWASLAFGLDYLFPRDLESVRQTLTLLGKTSTAESTLSDMTYQVTYYYIKLKAYVNRAWYIAGLVRVPSATLLGPGWTDWYGPDVTFSTNSCFGLSTGVSLGDLVLEATFADYPVMFQHIANGTENGGTVHIDRTPNSILSRLTVSCGYCFDLSAAEKPLFPAQRSEQDIFKEPAPPAVPRSVPTSADTTSPSVQDLPTGNNSEGAVDLF